MALLIAIALFVAQAINFALLLRERHALRLAQVTGPAVARIVDAVERPGRSSDRGRVRQVPADPIDPALPTEPDVERTLASGLRDAGVKVGRVATGIRVMERDDPRLRAMSPRRAERLRRYGAEIDIAVERPGLGWLSLRAPWSLDRGLVWRLLGQTAILYTAVLLPLLWVGRRIARPLRDLTHAAERFVPGEEAATLPEHGPPDVAALVAAFNALRLRVTAMMDEKDRMLGAIGHDLRTPLAALRVRIESVEDEGDRARMADTVAEMDRTLDDILSLARVGRPSEPPTDVDLAALVDAVVEDFRDLGADVTFVESERLAIRLRPSLMRRAVRNLIENAVKYGERAEVRIERAEETVAVVVADDGPGVPEDRLAAVFDPFTRLETSRNRDTGGIGLGLALAQAIVRDAGGTIRLTNRDGGGLDATILLPR